MKPEELIPELLGFGHSGTDAHSWLETYAALAANMETLDAKFAEVLNDCLWDLLERSDDQ